MTTFDKSMLPNEIDTVEKLVAWGSTVLSDQYPDATVIEAPGQATQRIQSAPFEVRNNSQSGWVFINRISLDLTPTWRRTGRIWDDVQEIGTDPIPYEYLAQQ